MKFNKDFKVIIDSLEWDDTVAYIEFLGDEICRHQGEVNRAGHKIARNKALIEFWESAIERHKLDVENALILIREVRDKFNL